MYRFRPIYSNNALTSGPYFYVSEWHDQGYDEGEHDNYKKWNALSKMCAVERSDKLSDLSVMGKLRFEIPSDEKFMSSNGCEWQKSEKKIEENRFECCSVSR